MSGHTLTFDPFPSSERMQAGAIHVLGFEFDGTACYRKGARRGPDAIRAASANIETYSPYQDADTADVNGVDLGNLRLLESPQVEEVWASGNRAFRELAGQFDSSRQETRMLVLGGEHSISYEPIRHFLRVHPDLLLLQLDAHADLRDGYEGYRYSHAAVIRRVLDHFGPGHELIQQGIRSGTREEFEWMRSRGTLAGSRQRLCRLLEEVSESRPIYLTLDLDYFDPSVLPGTGTPEPGGASFGDLIELLKVLSQRRLVAADVVELAPNLDASGISQVMAAECVRELILSMHRSLSTNGLERTQ